MLEIVIWFLEHQKWKQSIPQPLQAPLHPSRSVRKYYCMKQQKNEFVKSWTGGINPAAGETGISSLFSERNCISPIPIAPSEDVVLLQPANNPVNQYFQSKAWYLIRITVAFLPQHRNACASVKQSQNVKEGRSKKIQKRKGRKRELSLCWPVPKHSHLVHSTATAQPYHLQGLYWKLFIPANQITSVKLCPAILHREPRSNRCFQTRQLGINSTPM